MSALTILIEGLAAGAVPGLLASGLAIVHRTTGVLSFAHAAVGAAGAYAAYSVSGWGLPTAAGAAAAMVAGAALCLPLGPLSRSLSGDRRGASILLTLGWGLLIETGLRTLYGSDVKAFLHVFAREASVALGAGLHVARSDLLLLALTLAGFGTMAAVLRLSWIGLALRAAGARRQAAASLGLPLGRLDALAWALSGAGAGFAGWVLAPRLGLEPQLLWSPMISGFVAAAMAGLDRPGMALLVGLGLGVAERTMFAWLGPGPTPVLRWLLFAGALAAFGRRGKATRRL